MTFPIGCMRTREGYALATRAAGRAWSERLPNARRLDVPNVAHAPWIEAPDLVLPALDVFLDGGWPATTERNGAGAR